MPETDGSTAAAPAPPEAPPVAAPELAERPVALRRRLPRVAAIDERAVWWRALREFVVIVAGVLAALGAQAWWEQRQERENERRLRDAMRDDSVSRADIDRLVRTLVAPGPLPPPERMRELFGGGVLASSAFTPLTGSYAALLAGGDLRLVRTDSLRARIVEYTALLDVEREMLRFFLSQAFGDSRGLVEPLPFLRTLAMRDVPMPTPSAAEFERVRRDPQVAGILFALQVSNRNRLTHMGRLLDATRDLRRVLEAERSLAGDRGVATRAR
jgi:hypothetical protein